LSPLGKQDISAQKTAGNQAIFRRLIRFIKKTLKKKAVILKRLKRNVYMEV
jgi:hypothetical protein